MYIYIMYFVLLLCMYATLKLILGHHLASTLANAKQARGKSKQFDTLKSSRTWWSRTPRHTHKKFNPSNRSFLLTEDRAGDIQVFLVLSCRVVTRVSGKFLMIYRLYCTDLTHSVAPGLFPFLFSTKLALEYASGPSHSVIQYHPGVSRESPRPSAQTIPYHSRKKRNRCTTTQ